MARPAALLVGSLLAGSLLAAACAGGGRDLEVAPPPPASTRAIADDTPPAASPEAGAPDASTHPDYERLVTRTHGTFGLAESRGIDAERLGQVLEAVANDFERCATAAQRDGWLERAALRLVVELDAHGQVAGIDTKLDDPTRGGKVALMCLVAPIKAQNFGEARGSGRRGLALEVLFGPARVP